VLIDFIRYINTRVLHCYLIILRLTFFVFIPKLSFMYGPFIMLDILKENVLIRRFLANGRPFFLQDKDTKISCQKCFVD